MIICKRPEVSSSYFRPPSPYFRPPSPYFRPPSSVLRLPFSVLRSQPICSIIACPNSEHLTSFAPLICRDRS